METIKLTQGKKTLVDDCVYAHLMQWKWCAHKKRSTYYAVRNITIDGKQKSSYMHVEIMKLCGVHDDEKVVDHKNRNGLDNQLQNLHMVTHRENLENRKDTTPGFPGVRWDKHTRKWMSRIQVNGMRTYLGLFSTPQEAYEARVKFLVERGIS